jgi:hypothetical protein
MVITVLLRSMGFKTFLYNDRNISNLSFADAGSYNFTKLPILMTMVCREYAFWPEEKEKKG